MELLKRIFDGEIKGIDEKEKTLTAYVSTGARDRMDEVLSPEGVDLTKFKKNPVVLFAHDYHQPPIGKALWIKKDGDGILSKMQFANTAFAQEIFNLYKDGFMKAFSVGFIPKDFTDGDGKKTPSRTYNKWEMLEYSAVPVPANPEALALAMSKGILTDAKLKSMFEIKEDKHECEVIEETPAIEEVKEEAKLSPTPELLNEIEVLKTENIALKDQLLTVNNVVLDLRYKLLQSKQAKTLSEMTDSEILKKIEETAVGVIRKITGKLT